MKIGDTYKNYNELNGMFTYVIKKIDKEIITMKLNFPCHWNVPPYITHFNIYSIQILLTKL